MNGVDAPTYTYGPIYALPYWDTIGPFILDAVQDAAASTNREPRTLYPATVAFVLWCWQTRGTPLERPRIFRRHTVEEFIHRGMDDYLRGSRATHRSTLYAMVGALNPAENTSNRRPIPRSESTRPYTTEDIAALSSWAASQGTVQRRRDATVLLALGLGAGLATRELLGVRTSDITTHPAEVTVMVWERRPRTVPLDPQWQSPLIDALLQLEPDNWVFRPGRQGIHAGQITDFLQRARTDLDVRPSRMRATWLHNRVEAGTPPFELLRISGLRNLAALDKVAAFTPTTGHILGKRNPQ